MAARGSFGVTFGIFTLLSACGSQADESATPKNVAGASAEGGAGGAEASAAGACSIAPPAEVGDSTHGDLTIATADDAAAARDISDITGSLVILRSFAGVLDLPNLKRVGGDVRLLGDMVATSDERTWAAITELRLPNLERIEGELFLYLTGLLVETDLRSLQAVGERVYYMRNVALRRIGLDSLTSGSVQIQASPLAASCEIDAICGQVGASDCGAEYSDSTCACVEECGRLVPACDP
jgi:hypothetical protein